MPTQQETKPIMRDRAGHDYRTLLVHVEPGLAATHRVELAAGLARRFQARLIGVGAEICEPVVTADPYGGQLAAQVYEQLSHQIEAELKNAQTAFLRDAAGGDIEWRTVRATPALAIAQAARAADLIVTSAGEGRSGDLFRVLDPVDVIMSSGRPVLVAPAGDGHLTAEKVIVAWKDTRETRRAVADALPFLVRAQEVVVLGVCDVADIDRTAAAVEDVAAALRRHGAPARAEVKTASDLAVGTELNRAAAALGADLIVAGAYGHSRMVEWALGGVTRDLLRKPERYLLLSH